MAYKGPMGLWGPPEEDLERFSPFPVEGREELTCWVHEDVLRWMERSNPSPEGDYLFFVEGVGRLRFRLRE